MSVDPRVVSRLDLPLGAGVVGAWAGQRRTRARGVGSDLLSARPFAHGDDVRRIDWAATARTGELHAHTTLADRALHVHLVMDASASMRTGTKRSKWDGALEAAELLVAVARRGQEPVSVHFAGASPRSLSLSGSAARCVAQLRAHADTPNWNNSGSLAAVVGALTSRRATPGAVIVVTDAFVNDDALEAVRKAAHRHSVAVVEVTASGELSLPRTGRLRLQDPETGQVVEIDLNDARLRVRYEEAVAARRHAWHQSLTARGIPVLSVNGDEEVTGSLAALLPRRR